MSPGGGRHLHALGGWAALLAAVAMIASTVPLPTFARVSGPPTHTSATVAVTESGRALYRSQCASCHGLQGEGGQYGPPLAGAGAASADFYLSTGRMPLSAPGQPVARREPILTDEQIRELVDVVASFGDGPEVPQVTGGGDVGEGSRLYIANCAACHGATGAGNAIGGGAVAANLHPATRVQIVEAMRIGPGAMPNFAFTEQQEASIAAYVDYLREQPAPGGLEIGGLGAVAEGFVAVAIGLTLFVLAARFVGRRSREREPGESDP